MLQIIYYLILDTDFKKGEAKSRMPGHGEKRLAVALGTVFLLRRRIHS